MKNEMLKWWLARNAQQFTVEVLAEQEYFPMAERSMPVDLRMRTLFLRAWYADAAEYGL